MQYACMHAGLVFEHMGEMYNNNMYYLVYNFMILWLIYF